MWMYDDFGTDHRAQIKEKEEFKKNVLLPIRERYLRGNMSPLRKVDFIFM